MRHDLWDALTKKQKNKAKRARKLDRRARQTAPEPRKHKRPSKVARRTTNGNKAVQKKRTKTGRSAAALKTKRAK